MVDGVVVFTYWFLSSGI